MAMEPARDIKLGCPVYTRDAARIGKVKELRGEYFKVDAPLHPDFWLRRDCVLSFTSERVTLALFKDEINEHKVEIDTTKPVGD